MMKRWLLFSLFGVAFLFFTACDGPTSSELSETSNPGTASVTTPDAFVDVLQAGVFTVCKSAPDDPMQLFPFETSAVGPGVSSGTLVPMVDLKDGECEDVYVAPTGPVSGPDTVTITEVVPDGWDLDHIFIYSLDVVNGEEVVTTHTESGPTITGLIEGAKLGCVVVYKNVPEPPPGGGEGCTPGAWKNRLLRIGAWPVSPDTPVSDVWTVPASLEDVTLLEALSFGGGPAFEDKVKILLRAATAAYLNSLTVSYDLTTQQIIDGGNAAIASGDKDTVIDLAETLDDFNNQKCYITNGNAS